jgi:hypothetical protein
MILVGGSADIRGDVGCEDRKHLVVAAVGRFDLEGGVATHLTLATYEPELETAGLLEVTGRCEYVSAPFHYQESGPRRERKTDYHAKGRSDLHSPLDPRRVGWLEVLETTKRLFDHATSANSCSK